MGRLLRLPARLLALALLPCCVPGAQVGPWAWGRPAPPAGALRGGRAADAADGATCFEEDCRSSPFIMHASKTTNTSDGVKACFQFVAIGCYASPKGCCPMVARRFSALEFLVSE